jgi:hypothetical protein
LGFQPQSSNTFFAGPTSGPNTPPAFRTLSQADINIAGGVTGAGSAGQISFYTGTYTQTGSNNLFWDNSFNRIGIGTNVPTATIHALGNQKLEGLFNPTAGPAQYSSLLLSPTINQTGGADGATRGLFVQPTLTSAADFRAIEWDNNTGWGLYSAGVAKNYIAGNVGIGTISLHPSALLTLKSSNQGILVPRMTTAEKNNIQGPETSLLLFDTDANNYQYYDGSAWVGIVPTSQQEAMIIAASDETTNLATLVAARTFRAPFALTIRSVKIDVNTAPTGSSILVDLNNGANPVFTTRPEIEANELTSLDATTQPVLNSSFTSVAANEILTIDIDQVGSTIAGKGLKMTIYYTRN